MEVWLVRHGQTDWNVQGKLQGAADIPLNARGEQQAKQCADFLKQFSFDFIMTSPLQRAKKTAHIIADACQVRLETTPLIAERHFGVVEGMTFEERNRRYPTFDYPEAETYAQVQQRVQHILQQWQQLQAERIIAVSHGGFINALLYALTTGEQGTNKTHLQNGSITKIKWDGEQWTVLDVNNASHMEPVELEES